MFCVFVFVFVEGASVFAVQAGGGAHGADPITSPGLESVFTDSGGLVVFCCGGGRACVKLLLAKALTSGNVGIDICSRCRCVVGSLQCLRGFRAFDSWGDIRGTPPVYG